MLMQPIPGQPVTQQPVQVQAVPAQGHMPVSGITGKEEKEWGVWTPTPAEWVTGVLVLVGLLFWYISTAVLEDGEPILAIMFQGIAYMFWFGSIVSAIHSVEKALLNSKK